MAKAHAHQPGPARNTTPDTSKRAGKRDPELAAKARILAATSRMWILEPALARQIIRERQERGIDDHDEVWDGVYVMPPLANNPHQDLVLDLCVLLHQVIAQERRGRVLPGANVSDRRRHWEKNFRGPDVVVVLNDSRAVDCTTHWMGGPDFLVEIQSPGDDTDEKIPFYGAVQVRELLIVHRDTRALRLYRHDGRQLALVDPVEFEGQQWLESAVVPLAFRRIAVRRRPRTEVRRTDGTPGQWAV